jgi:hypothetical protein
LRNEGGSLMQIQLTSDQAQAVRRALGLHNYPVANKNNWESGYDPDPAWEDLVRRKLAVRFVRRDDIVEYAATLALALAVTRPMETISEEIVSRLIDIERYVFAGRYRG